MGCAVIQCRRMPPAVGTDGIQLVSRLPEFGGAKPVFLSPVMAIRRTFIEADDHRTLRIVRQWSSARSSGDGEGTVIETVSKRSMRIVITNGSRQGTPGLMAGRSGDRGENGEQVRSTSSHQWFLDGQRGQAAGRSE